MPRAATTEATKPKVRRAQGRLEAAEQKIGQDHPLAIPSTGNVSDIKRTDQIVEPVDGPNIKARVEHEKFMHEMVVVHVAESADPNAENPVHVSVNGSAVYIPRGHDIVVKRKYVEVLARAKATGIRTVQRTNADGIRYIHTDRATALKYPFNVVEDHNPNGRAWLKKILAEG